MLQAQELYNRYWEIRASNETVTNQEQEWLLTELRNTLRSVDWDIQDLADTLDSIQRQNNAKLHLDQQQLASRKLFLQDSRNLVQVSTVSSSTSFLRSVASLYAQ